MELLELPKVIPMATRSLGPALDVAASFSLILILVRQMSLWWRRGEEGQARQVVLLNARLDGLMSSVDEFFGCRQLKIWILVSMDRLGMRDKQIIKYPSTDNDKNRKCTLVV